MKKIFKILILILFINSINAQQTVDICGYNEHLNMNNKYFKDINNINSVFIGTWKWVNGNQTFKVILWKQEMVQNTSYTNCYEDKIYGHWEMIENEGTPNELVVFKSNRYLGNGQNWPPMILGGGSCDGITFKSMLTDNCTDQSNLLKNGSLVFTLIAGTNTAKWEVTELKGLKLPSNPAFCIPTNIILTKQ